MRWAVALLVALVFVPSASAQTFNTARCNGQLREVSRSVLATFGADQISGRPQDDVLDGSSGNDALLGQGGDDCLYGSLGHDVLLGENDDDTLFGGTGNDELVGGPGRDYLIGTRGNDRIWGGSRGASNRGQADCLSGGDGNDILVLDGTSGRCGRRNPGHGIAEGGPGSDRIYARNGVRDIIRCGPGRDFAVVDRVDTVARSGRERCERRTRERRRIPRRPTLGSEFAAPNADSRRVGALIERFQPVLNVFENDFHPVPFGILGASGYGDNRRCGEVGDDDRYAQISDQGGDGLDELRLWADGDTGAALRILEDESRTDRNLRGRYIDLPCGRDRGDQTEIFRAGWNSLGNVPAMYAELAGDPRRGAVAISYWYWMTYNPGPEGLGSHEGDWEHITVFLDRRGRPARVFYATHNEGVNRPWVPSSRGEVVSRSGGTHPIVHLSEGSHASYPNCRDTGLPPPTPVNDTGCPPPGDAAPGFVPTGFDQLGVEQTQVRQFGQWVCWRGRVGEFGFSEEIQGVLAITPPEMPYLQDRFVRNGVWNVSRNVRCPGASAASARAAQAPRPIAGIQTSRGDPFASLARCAAQRPGPEPGRTVVTVCSPSLLQANAERGLEPVPAALARQPYFVDRTSRAELTGEPVALRVDGGLAAVDGVTLRNERERPEAVELAVMSWPDTRGPARSGQLRLSLRPGSRLRVGGDTLDVVEPTGRVRQVPLRTTTVIEDE